MGSASEEIHIENVEDELILKPIATHRDPDGCWVGFALRDGHEGSDIGMVHLKIFVEDVEEHSLDAQVQRGQKELIGHLRTMLHELEEEIVHNLEDD